MATVTRDNLRRQLQVKRYSPEQIRSKQRQLTEHYGSLERLRRKESADTLTAEERVAMHQMATLDYLVNA